MKSNDSKISSVSLGKNGPEVGVQGLGTMAMGTGIYGATDISETQATLELALDMGVNLFDTADIYGNGDGEKFLSDFVRTNRDKVVLATKFGFATTNDENNPYRIDNSPEYIRQAVDASLSRLGTDYIDLYYMHRRNPDVPLADSIGAMADLVTAGKIRYLGLSEVTGDELQEAHTIHPISALQSEWSLFSRDIENTSMPIAAKLGVAVVPYAPLGRGMLVGNKNLTALSNNDVRSSFPRFSEDNVNHNANLVKEIEKVAKARCVTVAQVAIAWVQYQAQVHGLTVIPIPSTRKRDRLKENLGALDIDLTQKELTILNSLAESVQGTRE